MTDQKRCRPMSIKGRFTLGAVGLAVSMSLSHGLSAKSDTTLDDTLKWIDKHRGDLRAEWHTTEGPAKWQPDDYKNFESTRDSFWDRTIKWTAKSDCPRFSKAMESDGETYTITRAVTFIGNETDIGEQESTKDASYTRQVGASYTWRLKLSQVSADPVVLDYKQYLKKINQPDDRTVDVGTYYYICIFPKPDADPDAIIQVDNDQTADDGRGNVTTTKGHKGPVAFAAIATVYDKKMADRLVSAVSHLLGLVQAQGKPKEPF